MRVEDYGPGRIRPHERTHPGPKEDRLRLTRATQANMSPIFTLYSDPAAPPGARSSRTRRRALGRGRPTTTARVNRLWRDRRPAAIAAVQEALADAELLIADGHHRYETARVYADEIGGEGEHRYVLMNLVALEDEGLTVFPTHRLVTNTTTATQEALANALREHFDDRAVDSLDELPPAARQRPARARLPRRATSSRPSA